jgi:hypothetical protein
MVADGRCVVFVDNLGIQTVKMMLWDVPSGALLAQFTYENMVASYPYTPVRRSTTQYAYAVIPTYDTQTSLLIAQRSC